MRIAILSSAMALLCACQGRVPIHSGGTDAGRSAVLVGGRVVLPSGPVQEGRIAINLESELSPPEIYRLIIDPASPTLYRMEPGDYRLRPTRNLFGRRLETVTFRLKGKTHLPRFPASLQHRKPFEFKTGEVVALGIVDIRISRAMEGGQPYVSVSLDDSLAARREITQQAIRRLGDPRAPASVRNYLFSWSNALEKSLMEMTAFPQ